MDLVIARKFFKPTYTIGRFTIDTQPFSDSLEDKVRNLAIEPKIPGQTAIPYGRYRVIMSYSQRFGRMMPEVIDVLQFTAIRIHGGVTAANTEGCPMVGKNDSVGALSRGRFYSDKLNERIMEVYHLEKIWLEVVRAA